MKSINKEELHSIFRGIADKKEDEFSKLYEKYYTLIYAISFSMLKNKEDSEDITQQVFTKIWNMDKKNLPTNSEATWLYRLTKNETLNFLRNQRQILDIDDVYYINEEDKKLNLVMEKDEYNRILSKLNHEEQEIVSLKILSDLSFREISQILNIPIGTVQWKYYKSLHTLKILLSNLSMFIITITLFMINKTINQKGQVDIVNEIPEQENTAIEKVPEKSENTIRGDEEKVEIETNGMKEEIANEITNELIAENTIEGNMITENVVVREEDNIKLNPLDIGILSFSGIFLVISIIFSIIFVKHQQNANKKVSK